MSNQNFNIDVNVNADGLRKISQVNTAFDDLRSSIDGLNNSVSSLNKIQASYNEQNQKTVTWGTKIKAGLINLYDTFEKFGKIIKLAAEGLGGWEGILAGTFTLITTYGPQILDFLGQMFQSDKAKEAAQALKDYKAVMESYIDNISVELAKVQMLVNVANDEKLSKENRIEAIKKLNSLSPEYLKNLTLENSKTKEGKELLDDYIASLNRKAMEEAIQSKRAEYIKQRLELKPDYDKARKDRDDYYNGTKIRTGKGMPYTENGIPISGGVDEKVAAENRFTELANKDKSILKQLQILDAELADQLQKYKPKQILNQAHDKQYWETELAKKEVQLAKLDATAKNFDQKASSIKRSISKINKILSNYNVDINIPKTHKDNKQAKTKFEPIQQLEIKSTDFAKNFEQQQQQYDIEYDALKDQLDKKLIAETEFNVKSQQLKEKYRKGIGGTILNYHETELAGIIQLQGQVVNQERKTLTKLEEDRKKHNQELKDFELQTTQEVSNAAFSILQNSIKSQSEAKIKQLEAQKASELNNSSLTATQKKAIEDKYTKKEAGEKTKAFKAEQRASLLQAVINGALAITKATSQSGILAPFVIPGIIAETAIQVATIAAQKAPQYAKGGVHYQSDGRGALLPGYSRTDNMNAYLRSGEAVVVSEAMRDPWARLAAA
ncbi:hypothetical protein [Mucilaginibacter panaciglaebae]|uniref:Phage tail tape measure protein n=1 Tax=Mucilaginibacter panaciglaebae TaxID=502331 RepID=A0ABP7WNS3_9SPHI